MMHKSNYAKVLLILCVGMLAISACTPAGTATPEQIATATLKATLAPTDIPSFSDGFASADPKTFVIQEIAGGPATLDVPLVYDTASGEILQNVYETLVFYNREKKAEVVPMLATEVPSIANGGITADGLTYVFKIRKGVSFHSGAEMTAEDVAFSFQRNVLQGGSISPAWLVTEPLLGSTSWNDISDQLDPDGSLELIDNRDLLKTMAADDPAKVSAVCELVKSKIVADNAAGTVTFKLAQPWGPFVITTATASPRKPGWPPTAGGTATAPPGRISTPRQPTSRTRRAWEKRPTAPAPTN
jgi:peptide/nickel transport system substrate-binding protein